MQDKKEEKEYIISLKKIARGAGIVFLGLLLGKIIGYVYVMVVTRLGTEQYGLLNLGLAVISFLAILSLLGLDQGTLRYVAYYKGKKDEAKIKGVITSAIKICLPLSLTVAVLTFIFSEKISISIFHNAELIPVLKILSFAIPFFSLATIFLASLRAFQRIEYETGVKEIAEKSIRLFLTIILLFFGFALIGATVAYILATVIMFFLSLYFLNKVFPILRKIKSISYKKELLSYSFPLMLTGVLVFVIIWIDTLMLGYFKTASEVGIYNAAHPTAALMFVLPASLIALFLPIITELYARKKHAEIKKIYKRVSKWIFFVNFPLFLVMVFFSSQITRIIFGQDYVAGSLALVILVFGYLVYSLSYTSSNILSMAKKTKLIFVITLIFAGSNVLLNYLLIPTYGVNGAAFATSSSYIIGSLLVIFFGKKITKVYPLDKNFLKSFMAGIFAIVLIYYLTRLLFVHIPLFGFIIMFFFFLLLYTFFLFLFKSFDKEDTEIIKVLKRKLRF